MDAKEFLERHLGDAWESAVPRYNAEIRFGQNIPRGKYVAIRFHTLDSGLSFGKITSIDVPNASDKELLGYALLDLGQTILRQERKKAGDPS